MTHKEKAEQYVRDHLPELMEPKSGCRVTLKSDAWHELGVMIRNQKIDNITTGKVVERTSDWEIIGHTIQLQHWLRVLKAHSDVEVALHYHKVHYLAVQQPMGKTAEFNLTTGQPATESDYQALCNIFGI